VCPGRFLADVTIKLILIYLLANYDIKYPDGISVRPADGRRNLMIAPDMTTPILFKKLLAERQLRCCNENISCTGGKTDIVLFGGESA
jgi:hypothetical protein